MQQVLRSRFHIAGGGLLLVILAVGSSIIWLNYVVPEMYCTHSIKSLCKIVRNSYGLAYYVQPSGFFPNYDRNNLPIFWNWHNTVTETLEGGILGDEKSFYYKTPICQEQNPSFDFARTPILTDTSYWYIKYKITTFDDLNAFKMYLLNEVYSDKENIEDATTYGLIDSYRLLKSPEAADIPLIIEKPAPNKKHKQGVGFLDGRVERIGMNEKWPITDEVITTLVEIESHAKEFFKRKNDKRTEY